MDQIAAHATLITPQVVRIAIKACFYGKGNVLLPMRVLGEHLPRCRVGSANTVTHHVTRVLTCLHFATPAQGTHISITTSVSWFVRMELMAKTTSKYRFQSAILPISAWDFPPNDKDLRGTPCKAVSKEIFES